MVCGHTLLTASVSSVNRGWSLRCLCGAGGGQMWDVCGQRKKVETEAQE